MHSQAPAKMAWAAKRLLSRRCLLASTFLTKAAERSLRFLAMVFLISILSISLMPNWSKIKSTLLCLAVRFHQAAVEDGLDLQT